MNIASVLAFLVSLFKAIPVLDKWLTKLWGEYEKFQVKRREAKVIKANSKRGKKYEDADNDDTISDSFDELP